MKKARCSVCKKRFKVGSDFGGNICQNCMRENLVNIMGESGDVDDLVGFFFNKNDQKKEHV